MMIKVFEFEMENRKFWWGHISTHTHAYTTLYKTTTCFKLLEYQILFKTENKMKQIIYGE